MWYYVALYVFAIILLEISATNWPPPQTHPQWNCQDFVIYEKQYPKFLVSYSLIIESVTSLRECQDICSSDSHCGMFKWSGLGRICSKYQITIKMLEEVGFNGEEWWEETTSSVFTGSRNCTATTRVDRCGYSYTKGSYPKSIPIIGYPPDHKFTAEMCKSLCSLYPTCLSAVYRHGDYSQHCRLYSTTLSDGQVECDPELYTTCGTYKRGYCFDIGCQHGGTCHDLVSSYKCECRVGFTGPNCEGIWTWIVLSSVLVVALLGTAAFVYYLNYRRKDFTYSGSTTRSSTECKTTYSPKSLSYKTSDHQTYENEEVEDKIQKSQDQDGVGPHPVGVVVDQVGVGVEKVVVGVEEVGVEVDPVGVGVDQVGVEVDPVAVGVDPVGVVKNQLEDKHEVIQKGNHDEGKDEDDEAEYREVRFYLESEWEFG